nr:ComEC/Rec2 family competence protein [Rhodococcus sp. HNM0569]
MVWGTSAAVAVVSVAVAMSALAAAWPTRGASWSTSRVRVAVFAAALFTGAVAAAAGVRVHAADSHPLTDWAAHARTVVSVEVEVADDPRALRGGALVSLPARLVSAHSSTTTIDGTGAVRVSARGAGWLALTPGERIRFDATVAAPRDRDLTVVSLSAHESFTRVAPPPRHQQWASALRARFAAACHEGLPPDPAGLLPGLVVGDRSAQTPRVQDNFRAAGLTHLTAVSGANVSIVLGAVLLVVRAVGIGPRTGAVLAGVALVAFVVVARPSPSVVRAAAMGAVALLALVVGRRRQALPALGAAVIASTLWSPPLTLDIGFALSVAATAALIVVVPVWVDGLRGRGWPRTLAEAVAVTTAAFVVTAPILAAATGTVSVVSILANLLVAPVVGPVTVVGALAVVTSGVSVGAATVFVQVVRWPLEWILMVAERCALVPGAEWDVGAAPLLVVAGAATALLVARRVRRSRRRADPSGQRGRMST